MKNAKPDTKTDKAKKAAPKTGKKADKKADKKSAKAAAKAEKKAVKEAVKVDKKLSVKKVEAKGAKSAIKAVAKASPKPAAKPTVKAQVKNTEKKPALTPLPKAPAAKAIAEVHPVKATSTKAQTKPEQTEAPILATQPHPKVEFEKHLTQTMPQPKPQPIVPKAIDGNDEERSTYSKEDLEEFRQLINEKLTESRDELKVQQDTLKNSTEVAADGYNFTEFGSEMSDREQAEMLLSRTAKFINSLERALVRIENGTYGRCKITGKLIPKERLRMVPHTETSIEAKLAQKNAPPMPLQDV